jgi:hypothetical protein
MPDTTQLVPFAVKSYRYLRLSIVVVVLSLLAAVVLERVRADCWQGSISAYYYTPVHAIFVGALVALGVSLIAIKGSTDIEDVLLNVAGVLAPIVAFVPTSPPTGRCASTAFGDRAVVETFIDNNVLAFAIGGGVAIVAAYVAAKVQGKTSLPEIDRPSLIGVLVGAALLVVGLVWWGFFRDSFLDRAHGVAAIAMFAIVGVVMVLNARSAQPGYRPVYAVTAGLMVVGVLVAVLGKIVDGDWRHQILWLELLELAPFAVYWAAQTLEHWEGGVPTGAEREVRAEMMGVQQGRATDPPTGTPVAPA